MQVSTDCNASFLLIEQITVFRMMEGSQDIDLAILTALLKGKEEGLGGNYSSLLGLSPPFILAAQVEDGEFQNYWLMELS